MSGANQRACHRPGAVFYETTYLDDGCEPRGALDQKHARGTGGRNRANCHRDWASPSLGPTIQEEAMHVAGAVAIFSHGKLGDWRTGVMD